jgi:hypothetical protein
MCILLVSVPNNCGERHVLDAVYWPALISRASMRSSGVISAVYSTWHHVYSLFIYRHFFWWHIASSVGVFLSPVRWQFVFSSWRSWRSWSDFIAILRTVQWTFLAFLAFFFAFRHGRFVWMLWKTLFICFITFYISYIGYIIYLNEAIPLCTYN